MPKIFEVVDPFKYESFIIDLNKIAGEEGLVINNDTLKSVLAPTSYYTNTKDKISCIVRGIIKNHAFSNGNKRTACLAFLLLSKAGNIPINLSSQQLETALIDITKNNYSVEQISKILFI
jgi:prophage maintenance system killer protein